MSGFALGQKINICNLSENDLQSFSEKLASESGINIPNISKKTSLGYVVKFEKDLKILFINDKGKYSLYNIQGKNEVIIRIWKSFFNPSYIEGSKEYSNDTLKKMAPIYVCKQYLVNTIFKNIPVKTNIVNISLLGVFF